MRQIITTAWASGLDSGFHGDWAKMSPRVLVSASLCPCLLLSPLMAFFLHQPQGPLLSHWIPSFSPISEWQSDRGFSSPGRHAINSVVSQQRKRKMCSELPREQAWVWLKWVPKVQWPGGWGVSAESLTRAGWRRRSATPTPQASLSSEGGGQTLRIHAGYVFFSGVTGGKGRCGRGDFSHR